MNNISEQLLQAMDIAIDSKISKLQFDKTIKAKVYNIVDLDTGEYRVKYTGNIFSAFSGDLTKIYKIGDDVYIKVPEGNFSNKKIIEGKVSDISLSYGELIGLQNAIESISPSLDKIYDFNPENAVGIIAGAPDRDITLFETNEENLTFQQYAVEYELLRIKASFKTNFHSQHTKGNYGIEVTFFGNDDSEVSYSLDLDAFNGNPYNFSVYSPQSVILKIQKGYLKGVKSIKLFQENFTYDRYVVNGVITENENRTIPNIFVENIDISYVEQKDLTQDPLYLTISAPQGTLLNDKVLSIDLIGRLLANGENIMNSQTCECQWYKRDLSILPGDDGYNKNSGSGWKAIGNSNLNTLTLETKDVIYRDKYKLVVVYNNRMVLSEEVYVINTLSEYDCSLIQETENDNIVLKIEGNREYFGDWYIQYPDGAYSKIDESKNSINVETYLKYPVLTFYCQVFDDNQVIANLEYEIVSSKNNADVVVTYVGDESYYYDANGDIATDDYDKDRFLRAKLSWKDGLGASYKIQWKGPDGKILDNNKYNPVNSMIENLWIDNSYIVHYNIRRKFNINYNDNILHLTITTIDGNSYDFEKELLFVKDGDQGLNGTTYVVSIRPCDQYRNKLSGFQPLVYNNGWLDSQRYFCYVYKDGEQINSDDRFTIQYRWTGENVQITTPMDSMITAAGGSSQPNDAHFIKVEVIIQDDIAGRTANLYAIYPIDVQVGDLTKEEVDIQTIPSYIKYSAAGQNPVFENQNIKFLYQGQDYSDQISSLNTKLLTVVERTAEEQKEYYLKPAINFYGDDNDTTMGLLQCTQSSNNYIVHPIIMYLDTYGNEAINGWDGTKLSIDEQNGQYIFAPQVGAGEKDAQNRFTGLVMGKATHNSNKWGLYGYQTGTNSFGLDVDGKAWFGIGNNKIEVNGSRATIHGGGGGNNENGMTITLASTSATSDAIRIGAGKFRVQYDGTMRATGAVISGNLTANSGRIGNWTIDNGAISNGRTTLDSDGELICTYGRIGGWTIDRNTISTDGVTLSSTNGIIMNKGSIKLGENFSVDTAGRVMAKGMKADYFVIVDDAGLLPPSENGMGFFNGADQYGSTNAIGIRTQPDSDLSIIFESGSNGRFSVAGGLYLSAPQYGVHILNSTDMYLYNATVRGGTYNENVLIENGRIYAYFGE